MKSFLLVDDDEVCNFIAAKIIDRMGICRDVQKANNGQSALRLLNENISANRGLPDVILLDLNMPVMDGFDFIRAFGEAGFSNNGTRIIVLTSSHNALDVERIRELGVQHYLTKPLTINNLANALN